MAIDSLVDSTYLNNGLTSICNSVRGKTGGSAQLAFPTGIVTAIDGLIANSIHFATLLYAVNCKGDSVTTSATQAHLEQAYTNKIILHSNDAITVGNLKANTSITDVYFINSTGDITIPEDSDNFAPNNLWMIANGSSNPTVCYAAYDVDAYYKAMQKLLNLI